MAIQVGSLPREEVALLSHPDIIASPGDDVIRAHVKEPTPKFGAFHDGPTQEWEAVSEALLGEIGESLAAITLPE